MPTTISINRSESSVLVTNKLIRNTYTLLAMTLLFSVVTCALASALGIGRGAGLISTLGAFGLLWFVLPKTANSASGIGVVFAISGLLGFGLGPVISAYLALSNGPQLVMTALGGTGTIFLGLSAYALVTRRDFSFMGGFLFVGLLVVLGAALLNIFLAIPAVGLAMSAVVVLLMSGFILYDTSRMVHGGETNYLLATVSLYLNILNLFTSLLHLLGLSRDD
ncbi:MAG: Bax inhibitor-1/YccA family protein [Gammaproteobacteria bacterium]|nr:Bax inhibitor-1/YccA family protein [Gammaproteobacteria bacterium]